MLVPILNKNSLENDTIYLQCYWQSCELVHHAASDDYKTIVLIVIVHPADYCWRIALWPSLNITRHVCLYLHYLWRGGGVEWKKCVNVREKY